jgi:diadenosine tetraphosphate (Ap4A) HIT family hydrolase
MTFVLDPRLENDSVFICDWNLSHVRLHRNGAFPWVMLMPRREGARDLIDLTEVDQAELLREIRFASQVMKKLFNPTKLNVANLGNVVSQLHIHVVARFDTDKAWPGPIWNSGVSEEYADADLIALVEKLQKEFSVFA